MIYDLLPTIVANRVYTTRTESEKGASVEPTSSGHATAKQKPGAYYCGSRHPSACPKLDSWPWLATVRPVIDPRFLDNDDGESERSEHQPLALKKIIVPPPRTSQKQAVMANSKSAAPSSASELTQTATASSTTSAGAPTATTTKTPKPVVPTQV